MKEKIIIYQALVRLFGNRNATRLPGGTLAENGCGKMNDFDESALAAIRRLGCNYVWYTGLLQQACSTDYTRYGIPQQTSSVLKGKAGSPYAICDYYAPSADLAVDPAHRMDEFKALVSRTHKAGLKMLIDFVPNHVAREYKSVARPKHVEDLGANDNTTHCFNPQNNFYYMGDALHLDHVLLADEQAAAQPYYEIPAKATGNDVFHAWPSRNDWYETVKLNYGIDYMGGGRYYFDPVPSTWEKMRDILLYWARQGVDGFRCDMAFMVPVDFWHWVIPQVKEHHPHILFIAEIYEPALYHSYLNYGYFDYLYDKVGLYDTLRAIVECRASASDLTHVWQHLEGIGSRMLNFLENHDEQRLASAFFAGEAVKGRPALAVSALMNTAPYMHYFAGELGERGMDQEGFSGLDGRTTIFDYWSLDTLCRARGTDNQWRGTALTPDEKALQAFYTRVLTLANAEKALREGDFYDLTFCNRDNARYNIHRTFSFLRHTANSVLLVVANFQGTDEKIAVEMPEETRRYVGLEHTKAHAAEELITGETTVAYCPAQPVVVPVSAYSAAIVRLKG